MEARPDERAGQQDDPPRDEAPDVEIDRFDEDAGETLTPELIEESELRDQAEG